MINYLPNDPLASGSPGLRSKTPRADRTANQARFRYTGTSPQGRYDLDTPEFLFWQCRESALAATAAWEVVDAPLARWARTKVLSLQQNAGADLNAYYNRSSLLFFEATNGPRTTRSGASTDIVAHEVGHALLDAIRPDLWNSFYTEVDAFHEAMGDCVAILTALLDAPSRSALISQVPTLWGENFLEATGEDLADGLRRALGRNHPAALPRHAFNWFQWQLPMTLPRSAPPAQLSGEVHSFARVFSGCFYDLIGLLWNAQPSWSPAALRRAAVTAGRLLVQGTRGASEEPRFFRSVGEAMVLADADQNGGRNRAAIETAFGGHGIALAASDRVTPAAVLAGPAPRMWSVKSATASIASATSTDLLERLNDPTGRLAVHEVTLGSKRFAQVVHHREVDLTGISERLQGVVAAAAEPVRVGGSGARAAVVGTVPQPQATVEEVRFFVESLQANNAIAYDGGARPGQGFIGGAQTHEVATLAGKRVLRRAQFACACPPTSY